MAVLFLICSLLLISSIKCTSLPIPSRQVLFYPGQPTAAFGLQPIIPQANGADRIDIQQRTQFTDRVPNQNGLFYVYPNNVQIPSGAQSPNYNEIFPSVNVRPALNPNAVFIPRPPGSENGFQPDPDSVLISNVRPQPQNPLVFPQSNGQFFPGGAPLVPFNFNVFGNGGGSARPAGPSARPTPEDAELIPETVNNNQKPEKFEKRERSERREKSSSKIENLDKPDIADEQEILAAADKNSNIPENANRFPTQFPVVQPGQRFFVLNGQPQFYMYSTQPFQLQPQFFPQGNPQIFDSRQNSKDVETFNPNEMNSNRGTLQQQQQQQPFFINNQFGFPQNIQLLQPRLENTQNLPSEPQNEERKNESSEQSSKSENKKESDDNEKESSELDDNPIPFRLNYQSRQVFGAPILLRQLATQNNKLRNSGPNAENIQPELFLRTNKQKQSELSEASEDSSNVPAFEFARYLAQKQMDAKSSPQVEN